VLVSRRTLLKGTAAAVAAPAALGLSAGAAQAYASYFWVQATGQTYHGDTRNWVNPDVQFFDATGAPSFTRGLSYGAEFYKARLHAVGYH
jgi:hypothetical protein